MTKLELSNYEIEIENDVITIVKGDEEIVKKQYEDGNQLYMKDMGNYVQIYNEADTYIADGIITNIVG